jgi:hypothetical protein
MKVKIIQTHNILLLEEHINEFIVNVNVLDIKFTHILEKDNNEKLTALIMYED